MKIQNPLAAAFIITLALFTTACDSDSPPPAETLR